MPKKVRITSFDEIICGLIHIQAISKITTAIGSFDVTLSKQTTGKQLLDDIAKAIGLEETWWFGLLYKYALVLCFLRLNINLLRTDKSEVEWIDESKSVLSQVYSFEPIELELSVKLGSYKG